MKKKLLLICSLAILLFAACEKDDDKKTENISIDGQWTISSQRHEKYNGTTKISDDTYTNIGKVVFNSNGTFSFIDNNGTTLASGNFVYSQSSKTLNIKLTTDPAFVPGTILELTKNKIVFVLTRINNPPDNGADKTVLTTTITR